MYHHQVNVFAVGLEDPSISILSQDDWKSILVVERWLRIFQAATSQMSSTSSVTLSSVHGIFKALQDHLIFELANLPNTAAPGLGDALRKAFEKLSTYYYKSDSSPYYIWAASM